MAMDASNIMILIPNGRFDSVAKSIILPYFPESLAPNS